jgi:glycosyltransferase involved in cell wall biosynthesis
VEALMCGLPCIATAVGGIPDLIREGVEGFLIEPASTMAILNAMEKFAALSHDEMTAFHKRARARYEEACDPKVVGIQIAAIYRDILVKPV